MTAWKHLLVVVPAFLALDFVWLGLLMSGFYDRELGDLARRNGESLAPRWGAAALVYVLIPVGLVFLLQPHVGADSNLWKALAWGAAFGLVAYGVYDLTNLAVLEKWTLRMTVIDMAWGCTICAICAALMYGVNRWFAPA
jgi:uncharacterized membrane protein